MEQDWTAGDQRRRSKPGSLENSLVEIDRIRDCENNEHDSVTPVYPRIHANIPSPDPASSSPARINCRSLRGKTATELQQLRTAPRSHQITTRLFKMVPLESLHAVSYSPSIVTMALSCVSSEIKPDIGRKS